MKAKLRFLVFIVLALSLIFLMAACDDGSTTINTPDVPGGSGGSGGGGGSGKTSKGNSLIVMDPAMVASNLESISPNGTLVFANLEEKDMPVKGDIICSAPSKAAPYGFLYKVKTVTTKDGEIVVATEMATIEEAVEEAEVKQSFDLVFAEGEEVDGVEVVRMAANTDSTPRAAATLFKNPVKLNINKTAAGVNLKGTVELNTTVDCNIKIGFFTMERFEVSTKPGFKADLTATISGKIEKEKVFQIYKQKFSPVTIWVGPVPVVFVPEISIECVIKAEGEVLLSAVNLAKWNYSYVFGIRYEQGSKLGAFKENTSKPAKYLEDLQLDQITLNGEVKIKPKVGFMFGLYDMAYAGISGGFYGKLAGESGASVSNKAANAKLSLSCSLEFDANAELEILGYTIGKLNKTFYTVDWPIWEKTWSTSSAVAVTGVTLNKNSLSLTAGASETLISNITPSNATNKEVSWSSSNTSVATVSENGTVTAVAPGTATITVTTSDGGKTATCSVTVNSIAVTSVSLNKSSISLGVSGAETLMATITPANATNKKLNWNSSNTSVATVSANGVVIGVGAGTAIITAKSEDGNRAATCSVTVTGNSGDQIFTSWDDFAAWLATQPDNTESNPYYARINLSNLPGSGSIRSTLGNKYVSLDLSGSTLTSIEYLAFYCTSLTSVTIPNIRKTARFT